jgi:hypothetical protein
MGSIAKQGHVRVGEAGDQVRTAHARLASQLFHANELALQIPFELFIETAVIEEPELEHVGTLCMQSAL